LTYRETLQAVLIPKRSGWKIFSEYTEQGYTGANTKRPAFSEMMFEGRKRKKGKGRIRKCKADRKVLRQTDSQ
jgi:hypothetical protein